MFCPKCRCEFVGWTDDCPTCGVPLVNERSPRPITADRTISYDSLLGLLRDCGGRVTVELSTTDVGTEKKWSFPYFGHGLTWAREMQSGLTDIWVCLTATQVGSEKETSFPYLGRGFAWTTRMQGQIAGNEVFLKASKVGREKTWRFPYVGYGYAWTQAMCGECGDRIIVDLLVTDVGRKREWKFPYRGYGFAWANRAALTLTLRTESD